MIETPPMGDDPLEELKKLKAQQAAPQQPDPLDELKALSAPKKRDFHAEYRSGALQKRVARENTNDQEQADAETVSPLAAAGHALAATGANLAQGIPGMERVQAMTRSVVRRQPYGEALGDIRGQVDQIPGALKTGERIAGALPLAKFLPGSPVAAGAIIGGADQALSADNDQSSGERAMRTAAGAIGGAALGKLGEGVLTTGRALVTKSADSNIMGRLAQRAASARELYDLAIKQGQGKSTPAVQQFLAEPDIAEIVSGLSQTRPFAGVAADGPEMLDAVYKTLSDRAGQAQRGLESVTPSRPNIGRFSLQNTRAAQTDLLSRLRGTPQAPGPMPDYPVAVQDFAEQSGGIKAVQHGVDAMRAAVSKGIPSGKNLARTSPEALTEWAAKLSDADKGAASEGILGATKMALSHAPLTTGRRAVFQAPKLLRSVGSQQQTLLDLLTNAGLLAGNASR